ncbi:MAG TPA: DJ-1/PfpI family protein [Caulobacteraceae bacterium]|jgi:putative intracellular protease/amidase|nr:DJ-1/PfpI family protein [Caulobacteraceae bacterium]
MTKVIAFFQPRWAEWEAGSVLPLLKLFFKADVNIVTPDGAPVTSIGGIRAGADGAFTDVAPDDADVFIAIGSDAWINYHDDRYFEVLRNALERGRVVGTICAATIGAARAGVFNSRSHTSNGRGWLQQHVPDYAGAALYEDVAHAVSDDRLVTAPGSAPNTFASEILRQIRPEAAQAIAENEALMRREWLPQAV